MLTCSPPAVSCAENITLLYLLHSVPVPPSQNEIKEHLIGHESYLLTFSRERDLTSTLAFLSNTKDDTKHVPALCVEENPKTASLNVMLAVNRRNCEDGIEALQNLKHGLETIFTILSEISEERDRSRAIEQHVFAAIVSMCSDCILKRMRFAAKNSGTSKQPLRVVLSEAINSLKQVDQQMLRDLPVHLFTERAKAVVKLAGSWAKHQKLVELEDLIEGIYRLKQTGDLHALMGLIPNRAMCPSSRQNLVNIVSKVSRYREAAGFLCRTARKFSSLRRMKVVIVNLPKEAFDRVSSEHLTPQLASTITRISKTCQGPHFDYLCRLLKMSGPKLNNQFAVQTKKTLQKAKIHAEIQLVCHYELNASRLPPRVVCSSKDACFLCNAFIVMHGKMHTPRYYGRLYPGWRLPLMSNLLDLDRKFDSALEDHIKDSLRVLLSRKKKTIYPDPNESTLLTLQLSTSTLHTAALAEATKRELACANNFLADDTIKRPEHLISSKDRESLSLSEDIEGVSSVLSSGSAITADEDEVPEIHMSEQHTSQLISQYDLQTTHRKVNTNDIAELLQGVPQVSSIGITRFPQFHIAGGLELHVEHTAGPADRDSTDIVYTIEWLSVEKARELIDLRAADVADIEALRGQTSYKVDHEHGLLVMARGVLVRIIPRYCGNSGV